MGVKLSSVDDVGIIINDKIISSKTGLSKRTWVMRQNAFIPSGIAIEFCDDGSILLSLQKLAIKEDKIVIDEESTIASVHDGVLTFFDDKVMHEEHFCGDHEYIWNMFVVKAFEQHPNQIAVAHVFDAYNNMCYKNGRVQYDSAVLINILRFYNEIESVEKLGHMIAVMNKEDFSFKDGKKRNQILGVSKNATKYLETHKYAYESLLELSQVIDHNDVDYLVAYAEAMDVLNQRFNVDASNSYRDYGKSGNIYSLLSMFCEIVKMRPKINIRKLLNYLIKQRAFSSVSLEDAGKYGNKYLLSTPSNEAELYRDYLMLNPIDEWPQNLYKAHNIAAIEAKELVFSDEEKQRFSQYGTVLNKYKLATDEYQVEAPTDYEEFVKIGKHFQNCLPVCGGLYIAGKCDIYFVYKKDNMKMPYCAIEMNKNGDIIQAKKVHDADVDDEDTLKFLRGYVKKRKEMAA